MTLQAAFKNRLSCTDLRACDLSRRCDHCVFNIPETVYQRLGAGQCQRIKFQEDKVMKVLGFGDCCVDYYIEEQMAYPGGNAFNVAVFAKENGADSGF